MSYTVRVHPGLITCGNCGQAMRNENDMKPHEVVAVIACWNSNCEQYEVPLEFPMPLTELKRSEV